MRLSINTNKNGSRNFYVLESYRNSEGKSTTRIYEKLGTEAELKKLHANPEEWARQYIEELNKAAEEGHKRISVDLNPEQQLELNKERLFCGGYLFPQKIYYDLRLDYICKRISQKYKFDYDLNDIMRTLVLDRILFPDSKFGTYEHRSRWLEKPSFELHDIYRALEVIADNTYEIQKSLYNFSKEKSKRNDKILYYDCTNYFFESEQESGIRQYGLSKEHRPNPIVQMGLFMDGDGIPLAFDIFPGNTNEQVTLKPLEREIINEFGNKRFVVCTDSGLSSVSNRRFNNGGGRAFITTQSVKKLKGYLKEWALSPKGWHLSGSTQEFDISEVDSSMYYDRIFYKEQWINDDNIEQRIIVSFSFKYAEYTRNIRDEQLSRAANSIKTNAAEKVRETDYKRFIKKVSTTTDGEIAERKSFSIDYEKITEEEKYDGIYAVATNLEDPVEDIININKGRWQIEESFRIMKTEFKARPVYLNDDKRIKAHFTTCFIALVVFRYLEKELGYKYTCREIINGLKEMNFLMLDDGVYVPTYTRTEFTDDLHKAFAFSTDKSVFTKKSMIKIISSTKNR